MQKNLIVNPIFIDNLKKEYQEAIDNMKDVEAKHKRLKAGDMDVTVSPTEFAFNAGMASAFHYCMVGLGLEAPDPTELLNNNN